MSRPDPTQTPACPPAKPQLAHPGGVLAVLPLSRPTCLERALRRLLLAAVLGLLPVWCLPGLDFTPTATSNRITDISLLLLMIPLAGGALIAAWSALRWLLAAAWPGPLRVAGSTDALTFHLGPFGTQTYDVKRLRARYLFDLDPDEIDPELLFESLQPPDTQTETLLPALTHPETNQRLDHLILHCTGASETRAAQALRPFFEFIRTSNSPDLPTE